MSTDALLACLTAIRPPAHVEEWLRISPPMPSEAEPPHDYRRAVRDVLLALGVLSTETGEVTSPMAYYFVQSLLHLAQDGALTPDSWRGLAGEGCAGSGARLVHLLEETRLHCSANATPLRIIRAVMAVIKARRGDDDVYLMQYDHKAEQFQPIGGKQEVTDASSEAALTRELCEELLLANLTPGRDFRIHPLAEHVQFAQVSASVHLVTQYDHGFYHLTDIRFPVQTDRATRWISATELAEGKTRDGLFVSSLMDDHMPGVLSSLPYSLSGDLT
jgi:8-oxo-dGTP pyrophosphatase MutT (NUDIX family)